MRQALDFAFDWAETIQPNAYTNDLDPYTTFFDYLDSTYPEASCTIEGNVTIVTFSDGSICRAIATSDGSVTICSLH